MRTQLEETAVTSFTDLFFDWGFDWAALPHIDSEYFDISRFERSEACMDGDEAAGALVAISEAAAAHGWDGEGEQQCEGSEGVMAGEEAEEAGEEASGEEGAEELDAAVEEEEEEEEEEEQQQQQQRGAADLLEGAAAAARAEAEAVAEDERLHYLHCTEDAAAVCEAGGLSSCASEREQWQAAVAVAASVAPGLLPCGRGPGPVLLPPPTPLVLPPQHAWPIQAITRGPAKRRHTAPVAAAAAAGGCEEGGAAGEQRMVACA
jgi:hypothetical protein